LSRPDHWLYLGAELTKAEIALNLGMPYYQDRPLDFNSLFKKTKK
jgi:hypothetical protein